MHCGNEQRSKYGSEKSNSRFQTGSKKCVPISVAAFLCGNSSPLKPPLGHTNGLSPVTDACMMLPAESLTDAFGDSYSSLLRA